MLWVGLGNLTSLTKQSNEKSIVFVLNSAGHQQQSCLKFALEFLELKKRKGAGHQWLTPVILAIWKAEIRSIMV
jgi:hypothetical protein